SGMPPKQLRTDGFVRIGGKTLSQLLQAPHRGNGVSLAQRMGKDHLGDGEADQSTVRYPTQVPVQRVYLPGHVGVLSPEVHHLRSLDIVPTDVDGLLQGSPDRLGEDLFHGATCVLQRL